MPDRQVAVTGLSIMTALGRGPEAQLSGTPAFSEVTRFDTTHHRTHHAATATDTGTLEEELDHAIATACAAAGVDRRTTPLLLAVHSPQEHDFGQRRTYTSACVSASTALADAATLIRLGRADRVVVAAAYLVEPYQYALFDAGRALSTDGAVHPFSRDRHGTLLGDGVAAVVLETGEGIAELVGWARGGDAYHPVQPAPDGRGLTATIDAALVKAGLAASDLTYVNANATGTAFSDAAEAAALSAFEGISSTKGLHGHALEASGLVEFVVTVQALREGKLPVNAGCLENAYDLDLILGAPRPATSPYGLSLNSAFGGANTALVVRV
ncbi:beta-ketoacyl synthase N-terminal-like domain-containing protein [Kribbella sp. NPDC004536]|uniref:beta-ketoacyl synthase N-terminal-like domain-containing protein n=1 Tax=Kribbella sp. NPDC004536 TaxID=3364106 RepID=UPI00368AE3E4